ncbi:MAG: hypothetical protein ACLU4N_14790 [Butyricimonas faecihominis]
MFVFFKEWCGGSKWRGFLQRKLIWLRLLTEVHIRQELFLDPDFHGLVDIVTDQKDDCIPD